VIAGEKLGHLDQVALATERPAIDAHVLAGIELRIDPDRGLDLGAAWFRGVPLAWIAPAGEGGADSTDWRCSGARTTAPKARSHSSSPAKSEARESRSPPRR
jgi:hypothetical protein